LLKMHKLRTFLGLRPHDKLLFFELILHLTVAWFFIKFAPQHHIAAQWGQLNHASSTSLTDAQRRGVNKLAKQVTIMDKNLPEIFTCRMTATAVAWMLKRRQIPSTIYVGFRRNGASQQIEGHAWLCSGSIVVTGRENRHAFQIFSHYGRDFN